jgi:CheY-like chemotaxis protein
MEMKNVLIVDDENMFLLGLSEGLGNFTKAFNVLTAKNGQKAVEVMKSVNVDLVVTDLKMPVMDGYELLAHMSKNYPNVSVLVMTAFGAPEVEDRLKALGVNQYIDKPLDYRDLAGRILEEIESISKGYIRGVTLTTFLKLIEMEHKTCALRVTSGNSIGFAYFVQGELIEARAGELDGEEAFSEIKSWESPGIEIDGISRTKEKEKDQMQFLLREFTEGGLKPLNVFGFPNTLKKKDPDKDSST